MCFIFNRPNYCNAVFSERLNSQLQLIQKIFTLITSLLRPAVCVSMNWLSTKILLLVNTALNGIRPKYISDPLLCNDCEGKICLVNTKYEEAAVTASGLALVCFLLLAVLFPFQAIDEGS